METHFSIDTIYTYFPNLSHDIKLKINELYPIYKDINSRVNLISRKDIDNLYLHHVLHSLSIAKIFKFKDNSHILDIGTGGGFPGIPLSILFPNVTFTLVDSIKKKIDAVKEVTNILKIDNVNPINARSENIKEKFDFILSRAVGKLDYLLKISKNKIKKHNINNKANGLVCLKGGDVHNEIKCINSSYTIYSISDLFAESFFINKHVIYIPITCL